MQKMLDRQQINVQSNTPVLSISDEKDAEGYFTVKTKRGQVKAKTIVHANVSSPPPPVASTDNTDGRTVGPTNYCRN